MAKVSLLTDEDRDQLLKEMAYGIPLKELSEKFNLRPIQVEYQRGNNSAIYNMYLDFFCIKEEIINMELPELYQFVLNILWNKIKVVGNSRYLYKKKLYRLNELIPFANEILKRENLPLVEIGKPVKVRYSSKRDSSQQINRADLMDSIKKIKCISETLSNKDIAEGPPSDKRKRIEDILSRRGKRVNWKNGIIVSEDKIPELPMIKLWYRIITEGKSRPRGHPLDELNNIYDVLYSLNLLSSNWLTISTDKRGELVYTLNRPTTEKFEFYGFPICKRIEEFIDEFGIDVEYRFLTILCHLGARISREFRENNKDKIDNFLTVLFNSDDEYLERITDLILVRKLDEDIEDIFDIER